MIGHTGFDVAPAFAAALTLALVLAGCADVPVADEEEIAWSDSWFSCDSRFQCIVVQDGFCNLVAVNRRSAIVYQDWSRQQVVRVGERVPCQRMDPNLPAPVARCASGKCVYPIGGSPDTTDRR